jgi:hypothetical protein
MVDSFLAFLDYISNQAVGVILTNNQQVRLQLACPSVAEAYSVSCSHSAIVSKTIRNSCR